MHWKVWIGSAAGVLALCGAVFAYGTGLTSHTVQPATLGKPTTMAAMEQVLDQPGSATVQTVVSADWSVPLAGLVNLKRPEAVQAGVRDRDEPIHIFTHIIRHPTHGAYLVDTGVAKTLVDDPQGVGLSWLVVKAMGIEKLKLRTSTAQVVQGLGAPLKGVFFTHMHVDHISGMPEIPNDVPLYVGPGESTQREAMNWPVRSTTDKLLENKAPLHEWAFTKPAEDELAVVDVFGDATVFALSVPGHTAGSLAYVVRTTQGPVLLTGDTSHTRWGWEHGVEPGSFTRDNEMNLMQLKRLMALAKKHPQMSIRLGHQK